MMNLNKFYLFDPLENVAELFYWDYLANFGHETVLFIYCMLL